MTTSDRPPKTPLTAGQALEFASEHVALLSALLALGGVTLSTIFLYSYLAVFDWHLIWLAEYYDIIKFGLILLALTSGLWTLFQFIGELDVVSQIRQRKIPAVIWVIFAAIALVFDLGIAYRRARGLPTEHLIYTAISFALLAGIIFVVIIVSDNIRKEPLFNVIATLSISAPAIFLFAYTMAAGVKEGDLNYLIETEGRAPLLANLVLITSSKAVLWDGAAAIVVPLDEIQRMTVIGKTMRDRTGKETRREPRT